MSKKTYIGGSSGFNIYDLSYLKADRVNSGGGVNLQDPKKAENKVDEMCKKLLVNLIIEDYKIDKVK